MKLALFNDTATSAHFGCQAVSDAHARMLGRAGHSVLFRGFLHQFRKHGAKSRDDEAIQSALSDERLRAAFDTVDAVIVNGEGTIHHGAGRYLLAILGAAQSLGKPTFLVNAVLEETDGFDDVFAKLDDLTVREARSLAFAHGRGLTHARLVWDSALAAGYEDVPIVEEPGDLIVTDWHSARAEDVGRASLSVLRAEGHSSFYLPLLTGDAYELWSRVPATFSAAGRVLTGRHHGCYFALKAKVPFIPMGSNTHKVEGLLESASVSLPMPTNAKAAEEALAWSKTPAAADVYSKLFDTAEAQLPLTVFEKLGTAKNSNEQGEVARLRRQMERNRMRMKRRAGEAIRASNSILKLALSLEGEPDDPIDAP